MDITSPVNFPQWIHVIFFAVAFIVIFPILIDHILDAAGAVAELNSFVGLALIAFLELFHWLFFRCQSCKLALGIILHGILTALIWVFQTQTCNPYGTYQPHAFFHVLTSLGLGELYLFYVSENLYPSEEVLKVAPFVKLLKLFHKTEYSFSPGNV